MAEPKKPGAKIKMPKGTKEFPWFQIPPTSSDGKIVPGHFIRCTYIGIWKTNKRPTGVIKRCR